jgi:hypothetical protein
MGAHCVAQLGLLVSLPALELLAAAGALAGGLAVLCLGGKRRPGRPRGWYDTGYITTI